MNVQKQRTLNGSFSLSGKGLHTGIEINATFNPAPENTGYRIQRTDIEEQPIINAIAENVTKTQRGTVLGNDKMQVSTVEHGFAALYAMGIDNCLIQVDGPEFPILDGSSKIFVENINKVGIKEQEAEKDFYVIQKKLTVENPETGSKIIILPDEEFSITAMCSFDSPFVKDQFATLERMEDFQTEIAPARTFVFVNDIVPLLEANLIKGGDLDNAIVIYDKEVEQEKLNKLADVLNVNHIDAKKIGYVQHKPLKWANECTRHKLLDILGDIALIGKPLKGRIIAWLPGHTINRKFALKMRQEIRRHEVQAPLYDPNEAPLMDNARIKELLPHRFPMLLIDKIIHMGSNYIVGVKNVTINEQFFLGHFPQEAVMPGVLLVESMAQCGALLVLNQVDEPERYSTYFTKISDVKFRQKVIPGDSVIFKVIMLHPIRHGISTMKGYGFVGENVVTEATFMAKIDKNK